MILRGTGDLSQTAQPLGTGLAGTIYTHVAFDTNYAYWSDDSGVYRVVKTGGTVVGLTTTYAVEAPNIIVPDPDDARNRLYFATVDTTTYTAQTIWQVAKDGSNTTATAFVTFGSGVHPTAVAADATAVYWATDAGAVLKMVR
jgi:hypothetical protein